MIKNKMSKTRNKTAGKAHCIYLPAELNNKLMELSTNHHLSISLIVQEALLAYLNNTAIIKKLVKESFD